ncbi:MAG: SDR family oxidoreductase [Thermoanaerobaculia bacterium]|nr:SDR family oxidoreductase [Thermoanaerobaculia bacterium]
MDLAHALFFAAGTDSVDGRRIPTILSGEGKAMSDDPGQATVYAVLAGAGGVGGALCRRLAASGHTVIVGGRRAEPVHALADEIGGVPFEVDGRDFDRVEEMLDRAGDEGRLAGVANCAGSLLLKPAHLTTRQELEETVGANLETAFAVVRAAGRKMRSGGSVVLVSSAAASIGLPNHEAIAAAKGAVAGLTRAAAATYASRGLRVNAVAPGLVETPMTERIVRNERALESSKSLHALGRVGTADEVAAAIAWLLDGESAWITGQVWGVDGGLATLRSMRS